MQVLRQRNFVNDFSFLYQQYKMEINAQFSFGNNFGIKSNEVCIINVSFSQFGYIYQPILYYIMIQYKPINQTVNFNSKKTLIETTVS